MRVDLPEPEVGKTTLHATILTVDRFGNLSLNLTREHLDAVSVEADGWVELQFALDAFYAQVAETYTDTKRGQLILYEDSYGAIAIAIREGNAARLTSAGPGDKVRIRAVAEPE
jgi:S-adenosyl-L-methionine hydrolase (adenosine-forming)